MADTSQERVFKDIHALAYELKTTQGSAFATWHINDIMNALMSTVLLEYEYTPAQIAALTLTDKFMFYSRDLTDTPTDGGRFITNHQGYYVIDTDEKPLVTAA